MLHAMPDKTVRVTSRFGKGHGTVFFDLAKAKGFTLENDCHYPETLVLRAVGCYPDYTARHGDPAEAEADFADLNLMLADRHIRPAASSVPALASPQPSIALDRAGRKRRVWTGAAVGLAFGAVAAAVVSHRVGTEAVADRRMPHIPETARDVPPDGGLSQGTAWLAPQRAGGPGAAPPSATRQPAPAPVPAAQLRPPPAVPPRPPTPSFGLQP